MKWILLFASFMFLVNISFGQSRKKVDVLYTLPGTENVTIKKGIVYTENAEIERTLDIYYPPDFDFGEKIPAVLIIFGFADSASLKLIGSKAKDLGYYTSWSKVIAASGMAAIVYETTQPEEDIIAVLNYLNSNGKNLSIDNKRIGAFSVSGHAPVAVTKVLANQNNQFRCAAIYYGFLLTQNFNYLPEVDSIAEKRGFKTPRLPSPDEWSNNVPLLIVRSGNDYVPHLNHSMKIFMNSAIDQNLPITFINYPNAPHGFDYLFENTKTKQIIKRTLNFWKINLKNNP